MSQPSQPRMAGVQQLIDRLQQEGVGQGREHGEQLVAEARREAAQILEEAGAKADRIVDQARAEAETIREAGRNDVRLACRDAVLDLQAQIYERMRNRLRELVGHQLDDPEFLRRLILEVARRSVPEDARIEFLLPETVLSEQQLRRQPEPPDGETLTKLVLDVTADALREGVEVRLGEDPDLGVRIRLVEQDIEVDLSDRAIADLLLEHLRPRFRAIVMAEEPGGAEKS